MNLVEMFAWRQCRVHADYFHTYRSENHHIGYLNNLVEKNSVINLRFPALIFQVAVIFVGLK